MEAYERFGDLLDYPNPAVLHGFESKIAGIAHAHPEAASLLVAFHSSVLGLAPGKIEEIYTNTFDLRAESSLYVGHHLFGEDYKRSALMSRMKSWYK
jgi:nitrate reductase assembly molybdenum cofactor insertion protein NarJ